MGFKSAVFADFGDFSCFFFPFLKKIYIFTFIWLLAVKQFLAGFAVQAP